MYRRKPMSLGSVQLTAVPQNHLANQSSSLKSASTLEFLYCIKRKGDQINSSHT